MSHPKAKINYVYIYILRLQSQERHANETAFPFTDPLETTFGGKRTLPPKLEAVLRYWHSRFRVRKPISYRYHFPLRQSPFGVAAGVRIENACISPYPRQHK